MDIICHKIAENFVILLSSWPCLDGNILTNGIKVIIYAYAHMIIDYYGLKMIFEIFELIKSLKFKQNWKILKKTRYIYRKFC